MNFSGSNFIRFPSRAYAEYVNVTISELALKPAGIDHIHTAGAQLAEFATLLDQGIIRVVIDRIFPLALAYQSYERAALRHIQGEIVLTVD